MATVSGATEGQHCYRKGKININWHLLQFLKSQFLLEKNTAAQNVQQ